MKITSVDTSLPLRVVEATFVLEDVEESEKGLTLVWFWALCWPWNTLHQRALCTVGGGSVSLGQGAKDALGLPSVHHTGAPLSLSPVSPWHQENRLLGFSRPDDHAQVVGAHGSVRDGPPYKRCTYWLR